MASRPTVELYYDPFDHAIDDDPYPVWKRMRAEAPLYFNEKYEFYALSRYEDVARALPDWQTYRSGRGTTADILFSGIEVPPGILLFEDPPLHDLHRRLLSRVFTPRRMLAVEELVREFCTQRTGSAARRRRFRLRHRPRRVHADADDRLSARHSRGRPAADPRPQRQDHHRRRRARRPEPDDHSRTRSRCSPSTSNGAPRTRRTT